MIDLHLIGEGRHEQLWQVLGAHVRVYDSPFGSVSGVSFAVWAPNARRVSVVGDFNDWDGRRHAMRLRRDTGRTYLAGSRPACSRCPRR